MTEDMTVGELMPIVKAAAPGSVYFGGFKITYIAEFPLGDWKKETDDEVPEL